MACAVANVNPFLSLKKPITTPTSNSSSILPFPSHLSFTPHLITTSPLNYSSTSSSSSSSIAGGLHLRPINNKPTRLLSPPCALTMWPSNPVLSDVCATAVSGAVALSVLRLWEETSKLGLFDSKLNRKLVHISIGLVFMLCWPLFSSGCRGAVLASLVPGVNIIRMLIVGLGIYKDEGAVKSMSRFGDHRELLKGPLYYASTITFACACYWRTSPIGIAAICNLCAGDGLADIVGRRLGNQKLPYNKNKSLAGSIAMATAGFVASVGYMHYLSLFGFIQESWNMVFGFLYVSVASALVESLPISTVIDDNLTVPVTSFFVGTLVF